MSLIPQTGVLTMQSKYKLSGIVVAIVAGMLLGYVARAMHSQDANALLRSGFSIVDSEGYEIESFDVFGYWTAEPKP